MYDTELAGLVGARICHDPVGAAVNGTDLIRELGTTNATDELAIVAQSAERAAAMLKFLRLAFGRVNDPTATMTRAQLRVQAEMVLASRRVTLGWSAPEGPAISVAAARLACLMLLAGRAMLGMNGTLQVVLPASTSLPLAVIAKGEKAVVTAEQRRWLAREPGPPPESRQVEFVLIGPAAAAAGARIELTEGDGQLALRARPE